MLAVPAASSAAVFCGWAKISSVGYALAEGKYSSSFCLEIEQLGAGSGFLETSAYSTPVTTDWILTSKGSQFSAHAAGPGAAVVYYGTIKGTKLKGYFVEQLNGVAIYSGKMTGEQVAP